MTTGSDYIVIGSLFCETSKRANKRCCQLFGCSADSGVVCSFLIRTATTPLGAETAMRCLAKYWLVLSLTCWQLWLAKTENNGEESQISDTVLGSKCQRRPPGFLSPKTSGDNGFKIKVGVSGSVDRYVPGEIYTVSLQGYRTQYSVQKFTGFMIVVEPAQPANDINENPKFTGSFQLLGDALSKISEDCPNAVVHTSTIPKSEIQVLWAAPTAGTGCVIFKATVIEHRELWYMDDGGLSKELCEEETEQPEIIEECCACEEAKYEVTFEGLWSKFTHPKDFPTKNERRI